MKKLFSLILVLVMIMSCFALAGCGKKSKNLYEDLDEFDSYVADDALILGEWMENLSSEAKSDKTQWGFYDTTTLHITETKDGVSMTTVCTYNYSEETGELSYYMFQNKNVYKVTAEIDGNKMTFKDENGVAVKTFEKAD